MNGSDNFSRFAYKPAKPRLTFYERSGKENRPAGSSRPSSPNNAIRAGSCCVSSTPASSEKRVTIVPETPNDEKSTNSRPMKATNGRRKRWRVPSSSDSSSSEVESESESREKDPGAPRRTQSGLFSSVVVSKRRKRSENPSIFPVTSDVCHNSTPKRKLSRVRHLLKSPHCIREGSNTPFNTIKSITAHDECRGCTVSLSDGEEKGAVLSDQVIEIESSDFECSIERPVDQKRSKKHMSSVPPFSLGGDGWLTRRGRRKGGGVKAVTQPPHRLSASFVGGDLSCLQELFPQHSEEFLRKQLLASTGGVDEAIATILASDDPSSPRRRPQRSSRPRTRRLCLPSDDSFHNEDSCEDLSDTSCPHNSAIEGREKDKSVGRVSTHGGKKRLSEPAIDDDTPVTIRRRRRHTHRLLSLTSESGSERDSGGKEEEEERASVKDSQGLSKCESHHSQEAVPRDSITHSVGNFRAKLHRFTYNKSVEQCSNEPRNTSTSENKGGESGVRGEGGSCNGDVTEERGGAMHLKLIAGSCATASGVVRDSESGTHPSGVTGGAQRKSSPSPYEEILEGDLSDGYSDDNDFSERQKISILTLLNGVSREEACTIPGCSLAKADLLLARRPFHSWEHLVEVTALTKGLNERLLDGCVCLLEERRMLGRLLSECQSISSSIEKHVDTIREGKEEGNDVTHFSLPTMLNPNLVLKPYQRVGVAWLALLHSKNLNAILADEMGLGKTVQAIVFLSHLYELGWRRPHLIVVPASTLDNWARELSRWSPTLKVLTYWGSMSERADMRQEVMYGDHQDHYDIILSTYTVCIGRVEDRKFFRKLRLKTLVLDEGHMLKNMSTLKYNYLMRMQAERRLLLTGTPLQNNLLELMSLLSFVMPSVFRPYLQPLQATFRHSRYNTTEITGNYYTEQVSRAKEIMRPFTLRRLKKEVLHQLPDKVEIVERCPLTPNQWHMYSSVAEQGRRDMRTGGDKVLVKSMSVLTNLRKAANHPLLLRNHYSDDLITTMSTEILKEEQYGEADPQLVAEDMQVMTDFELHNLCRQYQSLQRFILPGELLRGSGKFQYLEKKLIECNEQGSRMLLFSQFTMMLDIVEAWLELLGHTHLRFDGTTPMNERQGLIDLYNGDSDILVFLLSTKAGGLGINLTSANVVVLHDIDFNPYNDKQAEDRCHRVGQTREVEVIRLVGRDTVEEEILKCAQQKLKLEQDMTSGNQLSKTDIASLLSHSLTL